jgi:TolB-like protein
MGLLGASTPASGKETTVLITEPNAQGVPGSVTLQIVSAIAQAFTGHEGYSVLTMADIKDVLSLEESRQLLSCQESACYAGIEKLKDVELLLSTTVGKVGGSLTVSLSLIETKTAVSRNRVSTVVDAMPALPATMTALTAELFEWKNARARKLFRFPEGARKSFAVLDLDPSGVSKETAVNLTQVLSAELKRIQGATVISRDDIKTMLTLEEDKQLLGCADDTSCVAEVGAALGVEYMVAGHVGKVAGTWIVSLRLIEPANFKVANRITESYVGVEDQLVGAVRHAGRNLVGLTVRHKGKLALSTSEGEGSVYLDGRELESLEAPITGLTAGRHSLRIIKEDYLHWQSDIYVHPGSETGLSVELTPRPDAWYESWIFWTVVAGVVVAGAGAGTALYLTRDQGVENGTNIEDTYSFGLEVELPSR